MAVRMRALALWLSVALSAPAAERWVEFRSGPFQVFTNAGERSGRETLAQLEQLHWGLRPPDSGSFLGLTSRVNTFGRQAPAELGDKVANGLLPAQVG